MNISLPVFIRRHYPKFLSALFFMLLLGSYLHTFAIAEPYYPGETLDPACPPGEVNCIVSYDTTYFKEDGNSFGALATFGTNDANALVLETNNTERMRVTSGGNVLIGTATDAGHKLDISGSAHVSGNVGIGATPAYRLDVLNNTPAQTATTRVANFSNAGSTFDTTAGVLSNYTGFFTNTATRSVGGNNLTNVALYAAAAGADNNYAAIFEVGNVGIGNTSPSALLTVGSLGLFNVNDAGVARGAAFQIGVLSLRASGSGFIVYSPSVINSGNLYLSPVQNDSTGASSTILLNSSTVGSTFFNSGNVAIGTTSAASRLDILPTATLAAAGVSGLTIENHTVTLSGANPTTYATIRANEIGQMTLVGTNAGQTVTDSSSLTILGAPVKSTNVAVTNTHALRILAGAVSTATNSYGLTVNAQTGATNNYAAQFLGGFVGIAQPAPLYLLHVGSASVTTGTTVARFQNAGGTCDVVPSVAAGISCTSDENLKKNIQALNDSTLEKVLRLRPVSYNMRVEGEGSPLHIGFVAQELESIFPDLVRTDAQGFKSVSYAGLTPYIVKAVQEMELRTRGLPEFEDTSAAVKVAEFLRGVARGEGIFDLLQTKKLCIEDVCIDRTKLKQMIDYIDAHQNAQPQAGPSSTMSDPDPIPTDEPSDESDETISDQIQNQDPSVENSPEEEDPILEIQPPLTDGTL